MAQPEENRPKTAKTDVILTEGDRIREAEEAEELAVPGRELLTEALEAITQAAASVLPEDFPPVPPPTRPRTGDRAAAGRDRRAQDADDRLRGGPRGPQDPGPPSRQRSSQQWGLDELLRGDPPWGASEDSPMNEGSEPTAVPTEPPR